MAQKLSATARRAKAARDLAYAKTDDRRNKKAENQRLRRARIKAGKSVDGLDYDHKTNSWIKIKENRGNRGHGTKTE
jgi:ribosomal protein L20